MAIMTPIGVAREGRKEGRKDGGKEGKGKRGEASLSGLRSASSEGQRPWRGEEGVV